MPKELLVGLVLAGVSALTWLAYTHPASFKRIYWPIIAIALIAQVFISAWSAGLHAGFSEAIPYLPSGEIKVVSDAIKAQEPGPGILFLGPVVFYTFMSILLWLHEILGLGENG